MADKEGKEERPIERGDIVVIQSPTNEQRMGSLWKEGAEQDKTIGRAGEVVAVGVVTGRLRVVTNDIDTNEQVGWYYHPTALKPASKFQRKRYYKKLNGKKIQEGSVS